MSTDSLEPSSGGIQCVWVSAGVLNQRDCDRNFDCDACPLHLALSRSSIRSEPESTGWPTDRLYSANHFWIKPLKATTARVGLTEFATQLFHPVRDWHVAPERPTQQESRIRVVAHFEGGRAATLFPIPVAGYETNPCIEIDAIWPAADPWVSGYLFDVEWNVEADLLEDCGPLSDMSPIYSEHRRWVDQALRRAPDFRRESAAAADGGMPTAGLLSVLGRPAYRRLVRQILGRYRV